MTPNRTLSTAKVGGLALLAYLLYVAFQITHSYFRTSGDITTIRHIVASEELILQLTPELKKLSRDAMDLQLPGHYGRALFDDAARITDVSHAQSPQTVAHMRSIAAGVQQWPVSSAPP